MLRQLMLVVGLVSAVTAASCAGAPPEQDATEAPAATAPAAPAEDVVATITQLERDWVGAIVQKDAAALDRLLADEFAGVSPTAHYYSKEMAIEDLAKGDYVVESMNLDEISVNTYGDVAVAFTSQNEKSRYEGTDISGHYHYTNVWAKKDGQWRAVASHGTRYDTGH